MGYRSLFLLLIAMAVPVAAAHGGTGHPEIIHQTYVASGTAEPGGFVEVDFEALGGSEIAWSVAATTEVNLNIHEHVLETVYHVQENRTRSANGTFEVPEDGVYSLMVVGLQDGDAAGVDIVLDGPFAVVGSQGLDEDADSPGPAIAGVILLSLLLAVALRRRR